MKQIRQYRLFKHQAEDLASLIQMGINESGCEAENEEFFRNLIKGIEKYNDKRDLITITIYDPI